MVSKRPSKLRLDFVNVSSIHYLAKICTFSRNVNGTTVNLYSTDSILYKATTFLNVAINTGQKYLISYATLTFNIVILSINERDAMLSNFTNSC